MIKKRDDEATDYEMSERLFLDIWDEYNFEEEITDKNTINEILKKIVERSKGLVVLDHYSGANYDYISKVVIDGDYTCIHWFDYNNYREKYLAGKLSEFEELTWSAFGFITYSYVLLDIAKLKFKIIDTHVFVLLQLNLIPQNKISKKLLKGNNKISIETNTEDLYTEYIFDEGNPQDFIRHVCRVGNLPYYTYVIQPKENIPHTGISTKLLLFETLNEVMLRLNMIEKKLGLVDDKDFDELYSRGNAIRRVLEYFLKHYCAINGIKLDYEQKYGYITLGDIKKQMCDFNISQRLIDMANELSHDSGVIYGKDDIVWFLNESKNIVQELNERTLKGSIISYNHRR